MQAPPLLQYLRVKLFFSFPILLFLAWPLKGLSGPPEVSCPQFRDHFQNLQNKISTMPSDSDEYGEANWFKNYAALNFKNCSELEESENETSDTLVCPSPNKDLVESEPILQFVEEWIGHMTPIERRQALQQMEQERRQRCDEAEARAAAPRAGESENQREDRYAAYLRDYADLCRTRPISRSPPGFPVASPR